MLCACSPQRKANTSEFSRRDIATQKAYDQALRPDDIRALVAALNAKEISTEQYDELLKMTRTNHVTRYLYGFAAARQNPNNRELATDSTEFLHQYLDAQKAATNPEEATTATSK